MGFIKILRWRIGGALNKLAGRDPGFDVGPRQRAAVFAISLGREHASLLFRELTPDEASCLSTEMNRFQEVDEQAMADVLAEFLSGISSKNLPRYVALDDDAEVARAHVRANTSAVVERLRDLWFYAEFQESDFEDDDDFPELEYQDLEPAQKAAVFMMWLPPELSSMTLKKFSAKFVHVITGLVVEMPFVVPKARESVLAEFMAGLSMGIPGLSVDDVGLPVLVGAFVRSDPDDVAKRLEKMWLSQSAVVVPRVLVEDVPSAELTSLQRAAVFFQSLSLPLAHRLLNSMEESEVERLLATVDELGAVDSDTRKKVLQELMLASKPELNREPQPIHVLGKAMGAMIRKKPEVVVAQLRKTWLEEN